MNSHTIINLFQTNRKKSRWLRLLPLFGFLTLTGVVNGESAVDGWISNLQQSRPEVPVKTYTEDEKDKTFSVVNGDAFAEDRTIASARLPFDLPGNAVWTRLSVKAPEYLSESTFTFGDGYDCRLGVYGQYGCKTAYYWTGHRALATMNDELMTCEKGIDFVTKVLSKDDARMDVCGLGDVLSRDDVVITASGSTLTSPFERFVFIFADDAPDANWNHPCRYVFLSEDGSSFAVLFGQDKPKIRRLSDGQRLWLQPSSSSDKPVDLVAVRNVILSALTNDAPNAAFYAGDVSHSYFVLISGGDEPEKNGIRFWADTAFMYSTLTKKYGVNPSHIKVLMSDGLSNGLDACLGETAYGKPILVSSPTDLDGDGSVDIDGAATWNNLCDTFNELKSTLTAQDQLFVFVTSHGGSIGTTGASNYDCAASLFSPKGDGYDEDGNYSNFSDQNLHNLTKDIACPIAFAIETCCSGGFVDNLIVTPNRLVATACNHYEDSSGMGSILEGAWQGTGIGKTKSHNCWARPLTTALRGYHPKNETVKDYPWVDDVGCVSAVDTDKNGRVSLMEAVAYAKDNDVYACQRQTHGLGLCGGKEHPQYAESTSGLGSSMGLLKQNKINPPAEPKLSIGTYGSYANNSYITLAWSGSSNATSYNVYRSTSSIRPSSPIARGVTSPYYDYKSSSGLVPGVKYYYWVEAINSAGSTFSDTDWGNILVTLSLNQTSTSFTAAGGTTNVTVVANTSWSASANVSWINLGTSSGNGSASLSYSVSANTLSNERNGKITVIAGVGAAYSVTNTIVVSQAAKPLESENEGLEYSIREGSYAAITGYTGSKSNLVIPETLGGYPVEVIGGFAFMGNQTIVNVTLPRSCRAVNTWAFYGCSNLRTVTYTFKDETDFDNDYVYAYDDSFEDCPALTAVNVNCDVLIFPYDEESGTAMTVPFRRSGYTLVGWCTRYDEWDSAIDLSVDGWISSTGHAWSYWMTSSTCRVTLSKGTGVSDLYYRVGNTGSWQHYTSPLSVSAGTTINYYAVPITGYTAVRSSTNPVQMMVSSNMTDVLSATPNTYRVDYVLNGGTHGTTHPTSATYDTSFYVSAPTRSGYTFAGWTVTSGLNTSTAKWGTSSGASTTISSSSTKCVNGTMGNVYFKNLTTIANGSVTLTANWTASMGVAEALDNSELVFTTGGDAPWFGQSLTTFDGTDAAQSGIIADNQSSWLQTTVSGPGTISFWWYASSESASYDYLAFAVDGVQTNRIGGISSSWVHCSYTLGEGSHTLKWTYRKDGSLRGGLDAGFVDQVVWTSAPIENRNPRVESVAEISGASGGTSYLMTLAGNRPKFVVDDTWFAQSGVDISRGVTPELMNKIGRNGLPYYQSFLFGFEPESTVSAADQLKTTITFAPDGSPVVSCSPKRESDLVVYTTWGKTALDSSSSWIKVTEANRAFMHFFKTQVELK